jgi:hypothetical protein
VEYFTALSEDSAWEQAQVVFEKVFKQEVQRTEIQFIQKESLG